MNVGYSFQKGNVVLYVTGKGEQILRIIMSELGEEYLKAVNKVEENEIRLSYLLSGEEKRLFLELMEAHRVINEFTAIENRLSGFKEGIQIEI